MYKLHVQMYREMTCHASPHIEHAVDRRAQGPKPCHNWPLPCARTVLLRMINALILTLVLRWVLAVLQPHGQCIPPWWQRTELKPLVKGVLMLRCRATPALVSAY